METAIKAAVAGVCAALMAVLVRKNNPELALCLTIAACAAVITAALQLAGGLTDVLDKAKDLSGLSTAVMRPVLKCVGIGIIARLGSDVCRDAGSAGLASSVELAAAMAAIFVALPLFTTLLSMVEGLA